MKLYYLPISSYSQKALMAFHEQGVEFTPQLVSFGDPAARAEFAKVSPFGKIPLLVLDDGRAIFEASVIIEHAAPGLIPADREAALEARLMDRVFDLYVNDPMQKIFFDGRKPEAEREPLAVKAAKATLDKAYALLDERLAGRTWAIGDTFTIADCAAAPALAYARMVYPFEHKNLAAYAARLAERPSVARVREEAAPMLKAMMGGG